MEQKATLAGVYTVKRYAKDGTYLGSMSQTNDITKAGVQLFVDKIVGVQSTVSLTKLRITSDTGNPVHVFERTPPDGVLVSSGVYTLEWEDNSADEYHPVLAEVFTTDNALFSTAPVDFGSKPLSENWHYTYQLTISGDVQFRDGGGDYAGLWEFMDIFAENSAAVWGTGTTLEVKNGDGYVLEDLSDKAADSCVRGDDPNPAVHMSWITWVWTQGPTGHGVPGDQWYTCTIRNGVGGTFLRSKNDILGYKAGDAHWTLNYRFSIND